MELGGWGRTHQGRPTPKTEMLISVLRVTVTTRAPEAGGREVGVGTRDGLNPPPASCPAGGEVLGLRRRDVLLLCP